jgi:NADH dehydrogenase FAD-containing subunit
MPGQIAVPIRSVLRKQRNSTVILGEVTGVDVARRSVLVDTADRHAVSVGYDYLVLATGVRHSYFGHDEFEQFAPGLKTLADAVGIRNRILRVRAGRRRGRSRAASRPARSCWSAPGRRVEMAARSQSSCAPPLRNSGASIPLRCALF